MMKKEILEEVAGLVFYHEAGRSMMPFVKI